MTIHMETEDMISALHVNNQKELAKAKNELQLLSEDIKKLLADDLNNVSNQNQAVMQQIANCIKHPDKVIKYSLEGDEAQLNTAREMAKKIIGQYGEAIQLILAGKADSLENAYATIAQPDKNNCSILLTNNISSLFLLPSSARSVQHPIHVTNTSTNLHKNFNELKRN